MKLKMNAPYLQRKYGPQVTVKTDASGTPTDKYWRIKLKDAEIDNCVEVINGPKEKQPVPNAEVVKPNKSTKEKEQR